MVLDHDALRSNASGSANVILGREAATANVNGSNNVAVGAAAFRTNTNGADNVAVGGSSLSNCATGSGNVLGPPKTSGWEAKTCSSVPAQERGVAQGSVNVILGSAPGSTAMNESIIISKAGTGALRMKFTKQGDLQLAMPSSADVADPPPGFATLCVDPSSGAIAIRSNNGGTVNASSTASVAAAGLDSVAVGTQALAKNTTGRRNVAVGTRTAGSNVSRSYNVAVGTFALANGTGGNFNIVIGSSAASKNTEGSKNVFVGANVASANKPEATA